MMLSEAMTSHSNMKTDKISILDPWMQLIPHSISAWCSFSCITLKFSYWRCYHSSERHRNDYRGLDKLLQLTILIKICLLESGVQKKVGLEASKWLNV